MLNVLIEKCLTYVVGWNVINIYSETLRRVAIDSHSQDRYHSSYYTHGKYYLWTLIFFSEASKIAYVQ